MCSVSYTHAPEPEPLAMLEKAAAVVLSMVNIPGQPVLSPLKGGGNNRVFRVQVPSGSLVLKEYFQHEEDPRDRLEAEYTFIKHVWSMGVRALPQPIARLPLRQLALYSWIDGQRVAAGDVNESLVLQAAAFVRDINKHRHAFAGSAAEASLITEERPCLPLASDACFTLAEHMASIEARLSGLITMPAMDDLARQAVRFAEQEIAPAWRAATSRFRDKVIAAKADIHALVPIADRVISPSDFGFHNAILKADGGVAFIDFEYAGWDDPAKLICDFFSQVAVPVPIACRQVFEETFTACLEDGAAVRQRCDWLLPLYRIKWCCMALGCFKPVDAQRRAFARSESEVKEHRTRQFELARQLLEQYRDTTT